MRVKIPAALSGIIAGIMLGMGRAIGETMTVLMATGNAPAFPKGFLESVRTLTATIAIELGEVPYYSTHYYALFAIGLVLFIITFIVNLISDLILHKYQEREL
jgi:phosphate transport system permease protein